MKRIGKIFVAVLAACILSSCSAGYLVTSSPDVVIYEDPYGYTPEILWLLRYNAYLNRYDRPLPPPPPPRIIVEPRREPPRRHAEPPRNSGTNPPRVAPSNPRPSNGGRSGGNNARRR